MVRLSQSVQGAGRLVRAASSGGELDVGLASLEHMWSLQLLSLQGQQVVCSHCTRLSPSLIMTNPQSLVWAWHACGVLKMCMLHLAIVWRCAHLAALMLCTSGCRASRPHEGLQGLLGCGG